MLMANKERLKVLEKDELIGFVFLFFCFFFFGFGFSGQDLAQT
jgi:hypothetical protein